MDGPVVLDGGPLRPDQVEAVACRAAPVRIDPAVVTRLARTRRHVETVVAGAAPLYGINTGFGSLSGVRIGAGELEQLQTNLIRSHAAGVGQPLPTSIVRATMLVLAASLCRDRSGVRPAVVQAVVELLNRAVTPIVPELGSVGASGDLAPLAHVALVLTGEGRAEVAGQVLPGDEALRQAGLAPLRLGPKEGIALINGTHLMAAETALLWPRVERLMGAAVAAAAMSIDAARATDAPFDPRAAEVRGHAGPAEIAQRLRAMLAGSEILASHRSGDPRVQDPYSFRCAPVVLGAALDALRYVRRALDAELAAVTDNPLVFPRNEGVEVIAGGNFHGLPIALPLDVLAVALCHVAGLSERRVFWLLSGRDAQSGLPPQLARRPGLESGLMVAQYAAAACCNELIGLAGPASVANLSTSAGFEDYNAFGPRSAAKARRALELAQLVVATELLCAAEGLEHHRPLRSGSGVEQVFELVRARVAARTADRPCGEEVEALRALIEAGRISPPLPIEAAG